MVFRENITSSEEFCDYLYDLFKITNNDIRNIIGSFHSEMAKGLSGQKSSLKMLPSFTRRPSGTEKGKFLALDLGGTNLRILSVDLNGKRRARILAVSRFFLTKDIRHSTGKHFFDFIADCIKEFLENNNFDLSKKYELGFTFSFPVEQTDISTGKLIKWTKGYTAKGVEGKDVIMLLNEALKRKGFKYIRVTALVNDAVGTLVAKSYYESNCDMGVILGTGTNACYPEKLSRIEKFRGPGIGSEMIINMEWGNFNKLKLTSYDKELDKDSPNPGSQYLEKMVSGMYLGEVTRKLICELISRKFIFKDTLQSKIFSKKGSLQTHHIAHIVVDNSKNLEDIEKFLTEAGITNVTIKDKVILKKLCKIVSQRSAKIAAAAISAVITWIDPELHKEHTVGIDGSLYEKFPGYDDVMKGVFSELFRKKASKINLELTKDGSGKGAAIIASIVSTHN
ncbi:MAG: hexokinase [Candidatus Cloacimonetes bacterium]|nr:hexokinase [Candidatus Cloacimonadota bacterium]